MPRNIIEYWIRQLKSTQFGSYDSRRPGFEPPFLMRIEAAHYTAMWDAWAIFHETASPLTFDAPNLRWVNRPRLDIEIVISYASYFVLKELMPADQDLILGAVQTLNNVSSSKSATVECCLLDEASTCCLNEAWPDPDSLAEEWWFWNDTCIMESDLYVGAPEGSAFAYGAFVGNRVVAMLHQDGWNQLGDKPGFGQGAQNELKNAAGVAGGYNARPYWDYSAYTPVNDWHQVVDEDRWTPTVFEGTAALYTPYMGNYHVQKHITPYIRYARPFSFESPTEFDLSEMGHAPQNLFKNNPGGFMEQMWEVLNISRDLTEDQKIEAEFFENKVCATSGAPPPLRL